jgi:hypothetical protein
LQQLETAVTEQLVRLLEVPSQELVEVEVVRTLFLMEPLEPVVPAVAVTVDLTQLVQLELLTPEAEAVVAVVPTTDLTVVLV